MRAPDVAGGDRRGSRPPLDVFEPEVQVRREERPQHPHVAVPTLDLQVRAHDPTGYRAQLLVGQAAPQPLDHLLTPTAMPSILPAEVLYTCTGGTGYIYMPAGRGIGAVFGPIMAPGEGR